MMQENSNSFKARVFEVVRAIPEGETRTYKEVATLAGNAKASRAVGSILGTNYDPQIPCHRVILSNGTLGGYNRGEAKKRALLLQEKAIKRT